MRTRFSFYSIFFASLLTALRCENNSPPDHRAVLPHNHTSQGEKLTDEEAQMLAHAKGKVVSAITPAELSDIVQQDTTAMLAVNFWKTDCQACLRLQQILQNVQLTAGESKLKILAVNLDSQEVFDQITLQLRKAGITAPAYQLTLTQTNWQNGFQPGWRGALPALLLHSKDGYRQFFQHELSENELTALVLPFLNQ
jgi:thiol-disulfide isomerase/thioredoxin